jgi:hypothetical protein
VNSDHALSRTVVLLRRCAGLQATSNKNSFDTLPAASDGGAAAVSWCDAAGIFECELGPRTASDGGNVTVASSGADTIECELARRSSAGRPKGGGGDQGRLSARTGGDSGDPHGGSNREEIRVFAYTNSNLTLRLR